MEPHKSYYYQTAESDFPNNLGGGLDGQHTVHVTSLRLSYFRLNFGQTQKYHQILQPYYYLYENIHKLLIVSKVRLTETSRHLPTQSVVSTVHSADVETVRSISPCGELTATTDRLDSSCDPGL